MGLVRRLDFSPGWKLLECFEQVHGEEQTIVGEGGRKASSDATEAIQAEMLGTLGMGWGGTDRGGKPGKWSDSGCV